MPVSQTLTKGATFPPLTAKEHKEAPIIAKWLHQLKLALSKRNSDTATALATATTAGLAANLPAAGTPGRIYYGTDNNVLYVDDGAAWHAH